MKITQIIGLGLVNGQYYDYSPDLSAILAAYDVSYDASSQDYNFADNYTPEISGSEAKLTRASATENCDSCDFEGNI